MIAMIFGEKATINEIYAIGITLNHQYIAVFGAGVERRRRPLEGKRGQILAAIDIDDVYCIGLAIKNGKSTGRFDVLMFMLIAFTIGTARTITAATSGQGECRAKKHRVSQEAGAYARMNERRQWALHDMILVEVVEVISS